MKRHKILLIAIIMLLVCSMMMVTGCKNEDTDKPVCTVIIVENHQNSCLPEPDNAEIDRILGQLLDDSQNAAEGSTISVIEADGEPHQVGTSINVPSLAGKGYSETRAASITSQNLQAVKQVMYSATPSTAEADIYKALHIAGQWFQSNNDANKELVIIGNGLCTTGVLNGDAMVKANPEYIVDSLDNVKIDLADVNTTWIGCGDLNTGTQMPFSLSAKETYTANWNAILKAAGADVTFVPILSISNSDKDSSDWPDVKPIDIPEDQPIKIKDTSDIDTTGSCLMEEDLFGGFLPDSAEYKNPRTAQDVLDSISAALKANKDDIILVGSTAGDSQSAYTIDLSQQRAEKVMTDLIERGIEKNRITAIGMGTESPFHISGLGTGAEAQPNRHIAIINNKSKTAEEVMKFAERTN